MRLITKLFIIAIFGILMSLPSCNPDEPCRDETNPDCINYDACKAEYPEKFEIEMLMVNPIDLNEYIPTKDVLYVTPQDLDFKTNFEYDSIFWQIGTDPAVHNEKSFSIRFEDNVIDSEVLVTARCHRAINTKCFGENDDGIDTLYQTLSFKNREDSPLYGIWRGVNEGESDSFDIEIERIYKRGQFGDTFYDGTRFTGLMKGLSTYEGRSNSLAEWRNIYSRSMTEANVSLLVGRIMDDGRLRIKYTDNTLERVERTFTAIKTEP